MTETKEEKTFLTDTVLQGNSNKYHLYKRDMPHPEATGDVGTESFKRLCRARISNRLWKRRDELVEVSEKQIRGNEGDYCMHCLNKSEDYDV